MIYYTVLGVASLLFFVLGVTIWLKTRSIAFAIGLGFIYYWTLWGGWFIVYDLRGGNSGFQYDYLYYKLFAVHLDSDYFWALVLYSIFILFVEIALLFSLRPSIPQPPVRPIRISHRAMIFIAAVSGIVSFWIVKGTFGAAADAGEMVYHYVYQDASISRWFTIHQILNRICLFTTTMGLAIHYSGNTARYIVAYAKRSQRVMYLIVLSGIFAMNLMLGFRQNMVVAFLTSALFYLVNCRKPRTRTIVIAGTVAVLAVGVVGMTRGAQVSETVEGMGLLKSGAGSVATYAMSNEPFVAHMSMYGTLHKGVELTYGSSMVAFIASWIPKIVWLDRPQEISLYYAYQVGSIDGQGYTIHHATGWYLNFGTMGLVFGAVLLGWTWGSLWNQFRQVGKVKNHWGRFFRIIGFWSFTASLPTVIRGGPEVYKLILLEVLLIPTLILGVAGARLVLKFNRPRLLFGEDLLFPIVPENSSNRRVSPV